MAVLHTTLGPKISDELGFILPHEHIFVDLRTPDVPGFAEAETDDVVRLMAPQVEAAKAQGVTALVECTTGGVGRRADIDPRRVAGDGDCRSSCRRGTIASHGFPIG